MKYMNISTVFLKVTKYNNSYFRNFPDWNVDSKHLILNNNVRPLRTQLISFCELISAIFKGSSTLAAAVCKFCNRLRQCRDRSFSLSLLQCNSLPHAATSNAASADEPIGVILGHFSLLGVGTYGSKPVWPDLVGHFIKVLFSIW